MKITKIPKAFRVNEEMIKQTWKWDEGDMFYKLMKRFFSNFELGGVGGGIFENSFFGLMRRNFGKNEGYKCVIGEIGSYCTYIHKNIHQLEIGGGVGVVF